MSDEEFAQGMIDWLRDKDSDIRHYVALNLNWDFAEDVLLWIVNQTDCDQASAAALFWLSNPDEFVPDAIEGHDIDDAAVFETVLSHAKAGMYVRAELAWEDWIADAVENYRSATEEIDPFKLPDTLMISRTGRAPNIPDVLRVENNQDLRRLFEGLGTHFENSEIE